MEKCVGSLLGPSTQPTSPVPSSPLGKYSGQIIVKNKNHQADQQKKTELLEFFLGLLFKRFSPQGLKAEKEKMATVKHGNGQEIEYAKINADQAHEVHEVDPAGLKLLTCHLGN